MDQRSLPPVSRRRFLSGVSKGTLGVALGGTAASLLAACGTDDDPTLSGPTPTGPGSPSPTAEVEEGAIVGDVIDYALTSDEWPGEFGWVEMRLHRGVVDGADVTFVRTDASDQEFARLEELVFVPRLASLADGLAGSAYVFDDEHPTVLSSEPGRDDYTPAWHVHRVTWQGEPRSLASADEVLAAEEAGELTVEATGVVVNYPMVTWSGGALPVDDERTGYLGPGQLLEAPDLDGLTVRFKLHECFPGSRYIVVDTSAPPMAEGMQIAAAPRLAQATDAGATGRVNVFMNGVEGPGPMGFQPSVFDSQAGDPVWSPYWDHLTYGWQDGVTPRVLADEAAIHAARDAGELDEFVGTPDTGGQGFVVNCPVPVVAPSTFTG